MSTLKEHALGEGGGSRHLATQSRLPETPSEVQALYQTQTIQYTHNPEREEYASWIEPGEVFFFNLRVLIKESPQQEE